MRTGDWIYSIDHEEPGRLVSVEELWGGTTCLVWLPRSDAVVRVPQGRLTALDKSTAGLTPAHLAYTCAAARIADALERDALLAPLETTVIPLPHQIHALSRAISGDRVRYLLADEVGLGKTIEAGLILRELKIRGLVRRTLVVAPAGLVAQWVSEMRTHFNEDFRLVVPGDFSVWRQIAAVDEDENLWRLHDQVVCPLDSVKPMDARRGWSTEQVARYNRERFEDLISAGWDLIIIDEAHRLAGATEQVARYRLGEALAQTSPYLLLLSATPHQGKTDAFRRLIGLLDAQALPDDLSVRRDKVAPFVIRTEKRHAVDANGNPLFKPRYTQLVPVAWDDARHEQRTLYDAVSDYVREGYNQALREKKTAIGFLMILMQRLVTSSTAAIRRALQRRLEVLQLPDTQLSLFQSGATDDWATLDAQEQLESLLQTRLAGLRNERTEVELLLSLSRRCEALGPDIKAQALLDSMQRLQREEQDPALKVLVFTEFVPTQQMLTEFLGTRGYTVACINGSMGLDERRQAQQRFATDAQVLISTDAGGEGLNLQFCHVVVNYDLPWNPMKLEQRIGRVDRIGQAHMVRALNFSLEGTVELRVREILEEKLQRILEEFGVDKLADVLDSEEGDLDFESLYMDAVLRPGEADTQASALADRIRERAMAARDGASLLGSTEQLDISAAQKIAAHQVPFWTERMTVSYLHTRRTQGARVEPDEVGLRLRWPDGTEVRRAVFTREDARVPGTVHLSLEEPRIRGLTSSLPYIAPGQPFLALELPGISDKVSGAWALWSISITASGRREQRMMPIFVSDSGRVLIPTAKAVWDRLIELDQAPSTLEAGTVAGEAAVSAYTAARRAAEEHGIHLFQELATKHRERLERERRKAQDAFEARRRAIERIGLPQVRTRRQAQLEDERRQWMSEIEARRSAVPELKAVALVRVVGSGKTT